MGSLRIKGIIQILPLTEGELEGVQQERLPNLDYQLVVNDDYQLGVNNNRCSRQNGSRHTPYTVSLNPILLLCFNAINAFHGTRRVPTTMP